MQRLDGPVRGNGKIIQELEGVFRGAGWNVIKVVWGRQWDPLFERDKSGLLQQRMDEAVDGDYQNYKSNSGDYVREHFFGKYPELLEIVADLSDEQLSKLNRGGHDPYKVFAAYAAAVRHQGQPTVILAKTVKGYGLGPAGEAQNYTHSVKKLDLEALKGFRDRFDLPIPDEDLERVPYYRPSEDSTEIRYLKACRDRLGGPMPSRISDFESLEVPPRRFLGTAKRIGRTRNINHDGICASASNSGERPQHWRADCAYRAGRARTFGMEGMFRQLGIYSSVGQLYELVDTGQMMVYR